MTITKTTTVTTLRKIYKGQESWETKHYLKLVPGNDEEINCWLCNGDAASHLPHLIILHRDQISLDGVPLCLSCLQKTEIAWQASLTNKLMIDLATAIRNIPRPGQENYAFDHDSLRGELEVAAEAAELAMNGLEIGPEAAAFLTQNGGAA